MGRDISRLLHPIAMPCRRGAVTLNLTQGCQHSCLYCYASAYRGAPPPGISLPYPDLLPRLRAELAGRRVPPFVQLSTASDFFQPGGEGLALAALALLLERGVGVSLLTKGLIPPQALELFRCFPGRVYAAVGLVSLDPDYHRRYEPGSAPPQARLENLRRLREAGIPAEVRIDPVIPGVTDREEDLARLLSVIAGLGAREATVSFLLLRPGIARRLREGLGGEEGGRLFSYYRGSPYVAVGASHTTLLPHPAYRRAKLQEIRRIAQKYGVLTRLCACKNPDLGGDFCHQGVDQFFGQFGRAAVPRALMV